MEDPEFKDGFGLATTRRTLPMALLRARELVMDRFRPLLSEHGLTEQQWRVLRVLNEVEGIDATELARRASVLLPSLTRIVRLLHERGLVETGRDPCDGRRAVVRLAGKGRVLILRVAPDSVEVYRRIEVRYGSERLSAFLDEVEVLIDALERDDHPEA